VSVGRRDEEDEEMLHKAGRFVQIDFFEINS